MPRQNSKKSGSEKKIFVLDTSVILFDHNAIKNFQEHDVAIPVFVLEELDFFKKGNDTINYEAREFIRLMDKVSKKNPVNNWIKINGPDKGRIRILVPDRKPAQDAEKLFEERKADHKILNCALYLQETEPGKKVILVSKDINLRMKAKALQLNAEDYETGKIKDLGSLYTGTTLLDGVKPALIDRLFEEGLLSPSLVYSEKIPANHYFILRNGKKSVLAWYNHSNEMLERIDKQAIYGIKARNAEQTFAIQAIMNPAIQLVTLQGVAGTGKTLLAMAGALEQRRQYRQIYVTRPVVPLSNKDIGYLPGDIKSKLNPYLEPLWDNLRFIKNQFKETERNAKKLDEMLELEKIAIIPLAYIRGRSLSDVFFIVDEAQNLTPHEVKTIISRAGEGVKIIFTGDIHQIDTPYLDAQSNGLSYLIDKLKGQELFAHVTLEKGERSSLANLANSLL